MNQSKEICQECLGAGQTAKASAVVSMSLRPKKCNTCKGTGTVEPIINSAFLNNIDAYQNEVLIYD